MPVTVPRLAIGAGLVTALAAGLALYGTGSIGGNGAGPCAPSRPALSRVAASARGDVAAMQAPEMPRPAPDIAFKGPDGAEMRLADLRGKLLLVNLWATWCAPCRAEMPALDALQREMGGDRFEVVAVNVDTGSDEKPKKFLEEIGVKSLGFYRDASMGLFNEAKQRGLALGLPVTLLVDGEGCLIGHMNGPAEWAGADARKLVETALGG